MDKKMATTFLYVHAHSWTASLPMILSDISAWQIGIVSGIPCRWKKDLSVGAASGSVFLRN